jgi:hypothetical protein
MTSPYVPLREQTSVAARLRAIAADLRNIPNASTTFDSDEAALRAAAELEAIAGEVGR